MKDNIKKKIIEQLTYIGYDLSHSGTVYLTDILYIIHSKDITNCINLNRDIYPLLSNKYKRSVSAIKASITYATSLMYSKCESKRLLNYFKFYDETKPSIKTVIYTILNKI